MPRCRVCGYDDDYCECSALVRAKAYRRAINEAEATEPMAADDPRRDDGPPF